MSMMRFHILFPDVAEKESRVITLTNHESLPDRTFLFVERYCVEPRCDCRRVVLEVLDTVSHKQVATINHGFDPPGPLFEEEGQTFLDPLNPQSNWSAALFKLTSDMLENDAAYRERLERH